MLNNITNVLNISRYNNEGENMAMHCARTAILSALIVENINLDTSAHYHLMDEEVREEALYNLDIILQENILRGLIKPFKGDLTLQMQELLMAKGIDNNAIMKDCINKAQRALPTVANLMQDIYINRKYKDESFIVEVASIIDDLVQINGGYQFFYRCSSEERIKMILEQLKLSRIDLPEHYLSSVEEVVTLGLKESEIQFYLKYSELKNIKRWNGIQVINKNENDLEHSYKVAALMLLLVKPGKIQVGELILKSLLHDFSEVEIGDVPTPIKYSSNNTKDTIHGIEDDFNEEYLKSINLQQTFLTTCLLENKDNDLGLVDFFDKVDACFFSINQYNLGNKYFQKLVIKTKEVLIKFDKKFDKKIYQTILIELNNFEL